MTPKISDMKLDQVIEIDIDFDRESREEIAEQPDFWPVSGEHSTNQNTQSRPQI